LTFVLFIVFRNVKQNISMVVWQWLGTPLKKIAMYSSHSAIILTRGFQTLVSRHFMGGLLRKSHFRIDIRIEWITVHSKYYIIYNLYDMNNKCIYYFNLFLWFQYIFDKQKKVIWWSATWKFSNCVEGMSIKRLRTADLNHILFSKMKN